MKCPECFNGTLVLKHSKWGMFYGCNRFPSCTATHSCHQETGKPMGIPADKETKSWRMKAHEAFDEVWKKKLNKRQLAYLWLRTAMGMSREDCHIGRFDITFCKKVIEICKDIEDEQ